MVMMKITFKLFATLTDYLPLPARRANLVELDVEPDATISQIIEPFGLPPKLVHRVLATCWRSGHRLPAAKSVKSVNRLNR